MVLLHGTYVRTMYRNERNGFTRFSIVPEEKTVPLNKYGNVSCAGFTIPFVTGTPILVEGEYIEKGDYSYIDCKVIREDFSNEKISVEFLSSGVFDGIGPATAQSIVRVFGSDLSKFAKRPDAIAVLCSSVRGMNYEKASAIMEKLKSTTMQRELFEFIAQFGGTYHESCKIFEKYGIQSIAMLKKQPYEAITKCKLSFPVADSIAKQEGFPACSDERLSALAETLRDECCESGDTYIYQKEMHTYMNQFLVSEKSAYQRPLPTTILQSGISSNKRFHVDAESVPARIYPKVLAHAEDTIVKELIRLERTSKRMSYSSSLVDEVEAETGMKYAPPQRASFDALKRTGVKIVTGGPGTGKTTTIRGLITAYQKMYPDNIIKLCAPTGRAAQRMTESTGMEAVTIHRLLEFFVSGDKVFHKDAKNPIVADLIVVDEMSMTDTELMSIFLQAVQDGTLVMLVGDIYQLPSVGPGDVLHDLIFSEKLPVFRLTKVYRQAGDSPIVTNANKINDGHTDLIETDDFEIIIVQNDEECKEKILELTKQYYDSSKPFDMQILAPSKKYESGTKNLNKVIQEAVNPGKKGFVFGDTTYRVGDKIIMLNNNYQSGYFNGDVGYVVSINDDGVVVNILDNEISITKNMMDDMSLAYSVTVHKSQGSEYPLAICALPKSPGNMLVRNLFYTAVTRAKKKVIVVAVDGSIQASIRNNQTGKRKTGLLEKLSKADFNFKGGSDGSN